MKKKIIVTKNLKRIKERASRTSLTIVLAVFVFAILVAAIGLTALELYILSEAGVFIDVDGDLNLTSVILFMLGTSLLIGGALAFLSSKIPLKPINNLINKMNRLAAGDFKARLKFGSVLSSNSAFNEISTSFNTMAEELEKTEMLRGDFINNFSHEFKTPIVSIAGLAKLLSKGNLSEEQKAIYLKSIEEESMRLSAMATNVLNLTKLENQSILTDISSFNVSEQMRSAILLLEDKWTQKNIDLQIELDEIYIEANEEILKEVWINLIDNAIKFTEQGGSVSVSITVDAEKVYATVGNSGKEIPKEKMDKVFNKFYQVDESHATKGNGIGLAIVKRIVDLHYGEISLTSEKGFTQFTVILPKKQ